MKREKNTQRNINTQIREHIPMNFHGAARSPGLHPEQVRIMYGLITGFFPLAFNLFLYCMSHWHVFSLVS